MNIKHLITISAASFFVSFAGAQPSPVASPTNSVQPPHLDFPTNIVDLGAVELVPRTPKHFNLGAGRGCTVTGRQLPDVIDVKLVLLTTNAAGTVRREQGEMETLPGKQCAIAMDNLMIGLTPTLKTK